MKGSWQWIAALLACMAAGAALGQPFPARPVKVIVPFSAGSGPDTVMRMIGDRVSRDWGQSLVIDNRPGANGWLAIDAAKKSAADGYTLIQITNEQASIQPHIYKRLPFDVEKDFEAVAPLYSTHFFLVVPASTPWKSVGDLVAAARAKPGSLAYGSWGIGSVGHVAAAMIEQASAVQMTHVPFKELPALYAAVANGDISWAMGSAATTGSLYRAGKLKYLALAAPKRLPTFADVPTVEEAGGPANIEARAVIGLYAPRGTPKAILEQIDRDVARALGDPQVREKLSTVGFQPFIADAKALAEAMSADSQRFRAVAKQADISIDP